MPQIKQSNWVYLIALVISALFALLAGKCIATAKATPSKEMESANTKKAVTASANDDGLKMDLTDTVKKIRFYDEGKEVGGLEVVCDELVKFSISYDSATSTLNAYAIRANGKKACVIVAPKK